MAHITKSYNFTNPALYDGTALEAALSAFLALVNGKIDATNMDRGSTAVFDWLNTRLKNLSDPVDLQDAVTLNYITNVITALHTHSNKAILDAILDAGSGSIITAAERAKLAAILDTGDGNIPSAAERARFLTQDQSDAMNAANSPSTSNPIATIFDIPGATPGITTWLGQSVLGNTSSRTSYPAGTNWFRVKIKRSVFVGGGIPLEYNDDAVIFVKNNSDPFVAPRYQGWCKQINREAIYLSGNYLLKGSTTWYGGAVQLDYPEADMSSDAEPGVFYAEIVTNGSIPNIKFFIKPSTNEIWGNNTTDCAAEFFAISS